MTVMTTERDVLEEQTAGIINSVTEKYFPLKNVDMDAALEFGWQYLSEKVNSYKRLTPNGIRFALEYLHKSDLSTIEEDYFQMNCDSLATGLDITLNGKDSFTAKSVWEGEHERLKKIPKNFNTGTGFFGLLFIAAERAEISLTAGIVNYISCIADFYND
jgi:hypothetical protein